MTGSEEGKMKVTVLMGGSSTEREISLANGFGVATALIARGHDVKALDHASGSVV